MTIDQILDVHFPEEWRNDHEPSLDELAAMRDALRALLPVDAQVEVTCWMNLISLTVWTPTHGGDGRVKRTCRVVIDLSGTHTVGENK